jgi:regulator of protease activity HflC (stomatin/prohibitin superfamily)
MKGLIGAITTGVVLIFAVILLCICTVKIPAGYVGVVYSMNGGVAEETLSQGWHLVAPTKHVTKYTVGIEQSYLTSEDKGDSEKDESFTASSSEGKAVNIDLTFTYQYDATRVSEVFTKFKGKSGEDVKDSFIKPNVISWTKEVISRYKVADMLGEKRADINAEITEYLAEKAEPYGIIISNASLINITVDAQTEQAINDKIKAQQDAERQAVENQMNIDKATADADAARIAAQGEADALLIEAEAEAEANQTLSESLTDNIIKQNYIDKWDGQLPTYSGGGADTIVDLGNIAN